MRHATLQPEIRPAIFPPPKPQPQKEPEKPISNMSRRRIEGAGSIRRPTDTSDEFGDDGIDDADLMGVAAGGDLDFAHIEDFGNSTLAAARKNTAKNTAANKGKRKAEDSEEEEEDEPLQLANGKWACNHRCGDKTKCKHMCCTDGLDKKPKRPKKKKTTIASTQKESDKGKDKAQTKLKLTVSKAKSSADVEQVDLTQEEKKKDFAANGPRDFVNLDQLHTSIQKKDPPASVSAIMHKKPAYSYAKGGAPNLSFLSKEVEPEAPTPTNYDDSWMDGLTSPPELPKAAEASTRPKFMRKNHAPEPSDPIEDADMEPILTPLATDERTMFGGNDSELEDVMRGVADSQELQDAQWGINNRDLYGDDFFNESFNAQLEDEERMEEQGETNIDPDEDAFMQDARPLPEAGSSSSVLPTQALPPEKGHSPSFNCTSSSQSPAHAQTPTTSDIESENPTKKAVRPSDFLNMHTSSDSVAEDKENAIPADNVVEAQKEEDNFSHIVVPKGYEEVEPWLLAEFGDVVELI
jgi:ATP-dependent DNA helicase HFM1/MER3